MASEFENGDIVMDDEGNVAQRVDAFDVTGWYVLGWEDELYKDSDLKLPLTLMVPVAQPPAKGRADTSLYRITYNNDSVKYGPRRVLGPVVGHALAGNSSWSKRPVKIERAVEPQFTDVTDEFL